MVHSESISEYSKSLVKVGEGICGSKYWAESKRRGEILALNVEAQPINLSK